MHVFGIFVCYLALLVYRGTEVSRYSSHPGREHLARDQVQPSDHFGLTDYINSDGHDGIGESLEDEALVLMRAHIKALPVRGALCSCVHVLELGWGQPPSSTCSGDVSPRRAANISCTITRSVLVKKNSREQGRGIISTLSKIGLVVRHFQCNSKDRICLRT